MALSRRYCIEEAGQSSAAWEPASRRFRKALVDEGLPYIDLDKVGHDVLLWDTVKEELVETFGEDILDEDGEGDPPGAGGQGVRESGGNAQAQPHHHAAHRGRLHRPAWPNWSAKGHEAVVVEYFGVQSRASSARVLRRRSNRCPGAARPAHRTRAVASGSEESDVPPHCPADHRRRPDDRGADVVFNNDGTPDELRNQVLFVVAGIPKEATATAALSSCLLSQPKRVLLVHS